MAVLNYEWNTSFTSILEKDRQTEEKKKTGNRNSLFYLQVCIVAISKDCRVSYWGLLIFL